MKLCLEKRGAAGAFSFAQISLSVASAKAGVLVLVTFRGIPFPRRVSEGSHLLKLRSSYSTATAFSTNGGGKVLGLFGSVRSMCAVSIHSCKNLGY